MPIYMGFFDQPNVLNRTLRGEVRAKGFEGWIELRTAQLGTGRSITGTTSSVGMSAGPSPTEMTVSRLQDGLSTTLFRESMDGKGKLVVIAFVGEDGTAALTLVLRDTMISGYAMSGKASGVGADRPRETLTLNFTSITYNTKDKAPDVRRWSL